MPDELIKSITEIQKRLARDVFTSEAAVSLGIIQPVLQGLGWDTSNPEQVHPQYSFAEGRKADFALLVNDAPNVIIEAKKIGHTANAEPQLFQYVFMAGALLAVLTDGREWRVYLTFVPGSGGARLVHNLNLAERTPQEAAKILRRYISSNEVTAGKAAENAKYDLEKQINRQAAKKAIPDAWKELIDKENSPIVEALINETASNCGHPPDWEDVHEFLHDFGDATPPPAHTKTTKHTDATTVKKNTANAKNLIKYTLLGVEYEVKGAINAYEDIIRKLASRSRSFLENFEQELKGSRKHTGRLTRKRRDISERLSIQKSAKEIASGWFLRTHTNNPEKMASLKKACKAAGIKFGKDLKIKLPNA